MKLKDLAGYDLGTRTVEFSADDAILYALAVGASASQLDLVYERYLRVLPTYACALGLWAVEAAGKLDAYDPTRSLHVGQSLSVHEPLQPGPTPISGRVRSVHDKLHLTIVHIDVVASSFRRRLYDPAARGGRLGRRSASADRDGPWTGADLDRIGPRRA